MRLTLVQHACRVYFSGIRSRDRPRLFFKYGIIEHRADTMAKPLGMELNGTPMRQRRRRRILYCPASGTTACHASYRILIARVTRPVPIYRGAYRWFYSLYGSRWLATVHYGAGKRTNDRQLYAGLLTRRGWMASLGGGISGSL